MAPKSPTTPCSPDADGTVDAATVDDVSSAASPSLTKSVFQLASGRAVAVAVSVLSTPIVTRLYDEANFGIAGIVVAVAMLLYPFTSGFCYHMAMPLAVSISERRALFLLSVVLGLLATALVTLVTLISGEWIATLCGRPEFARYVILVPMFCLCSTVVNTTTMALNCERKFGHVAIRSAVDGIVRRVVQIAAGLAGLGHSAAGLLAGSLSGVWAGGLTLSVAPVRSLLRGGGKQLEITQLRSAAVTYKYFPLFRMWSEVLTSVTSGFPMLFMGFFFPSMQIAGCYAVAKTLLILPLRLFTNTSREAFYVEAAKSTSRGESAADPTTQLLRLLSLVTAFPLTAVAVLGPLLFEVALGARWHEAGVYAQILVPWVAIVAVGQPLSAMFDATSKLGEGLICNVGLLVTQAVLMFLSGYFFGARAALAGYSVGTVLIWTYILARTLGLARVGRIRAARLLVAPYVEALLLLAPAGVLYWGFEMKISSLVALGAVCVVQAMILSKRYPGIRARAMKAISNSKVFWKR